MKRSRAAKRSNKRATLSGVAALTLFDIAAAQAQTPPVFNWTGFYVGGNAGYRWANVDGTAPIGGFPIVTPGFPGTVVFPTVNTSFSVHPNGGVYGVHGGYNALVSPTFLIGVEGDFSWGKGSSSTSLTLFDPGTGAVSTNIFSATTDWSTSLRSRFGYVNGPWLIYATSGVSILRTTVSGAGGFSASGCSGFLCTDSFVTTSSSAFSLSKTIAGIIFGGGIEHLFGNGVMLRIEYLFADYGHVNFGNAVITSSFHDNFFCNCSVTSTSIGNVSANVTTQTVRVGLSAKIP